MQINVKGVLLDPLGNPLTDHRIRVTTVRADNSVETSVSIYDTNDQGEYDFLLSEGTFEIEILFNNTYMLIDTVIVNDSVPSPISLPELIQYTKPVVATDIIDFTPAEKSILDLLDNNSLAVHKDLQHTVVDVNTHSTVQLSTDVDASATEKKAKQLSEVNICDAGVTYDSEVYCNDTDRLVGHAVSIRASSNEIKQSNKVTNAYVTKTSNMTLGNKNLEHVVLLEDLVQDTITHTYGSKSYMNQITLDDTDIVIKKESSNTGSVIDEDTISASTVKRVNTYTLSTNNLVTGYDISNVLDNTLTFNNTQVSYKDSLNLNSGYLQDIEYIDGDTTVSNLKDIRTNILVNDSVTKSNASTMNITNSYNIGSRGILTNTAGDAAGITNTKTITHSTVNKVTETKELSGTSVVGTKELSYAASINISDVDILKTNESSNKKTYNLNSTTMSNITGFTNYNNSNVLVNAYDFNDSSGSIRDFITMSSLEHLKNYVSIRGSKETSVVHTNNGTQTARVITVDNFQVKRLGNTLLEADTVNDRVTIRGTLRVTGIEDDDGNPLDPKDGDTIYPVFQFAETSAGPWHDQMTQFDDWKRDNFSINGVVDQGAWSLPYRFRGEPGEDGNNGDTIYYEYQYSPNGNSDWTEYLKAGDAFRRERRVVNGVPEEWSDPARIRGDDGSEIEIRSQYSIDGINNWHDTLNPDDKYERRARFVNGIQDSPWSDPFKIASNSTYKSIVFKRSEFRPSTPTGGSWNNPVPSGWEDGVPSGDLQLWGSNRIFSEDGAAPQQSSWSTPQPMTDTETLDYEYSTVAVDEDPGNPSTNPSNWFNTPTVDSNWLALRTKKNGIWGDWEVLLIRGEQGPEGESGIPGLNGSGWYSIVGYNGVWPGDSVATAEFLAEFGRVPQLNDHLFYVNSATNATASDGRRCITTAGETPIQWNDPVAYFDGDVIVRGTLSAEHLVANTLTGNEINSQTTIIAGSGSSTAGMNGYDLATLPSWLGGGSNIYSGWRFWSGASNPNSAAFRVNSSGKLWANNAEITGKVTATSGKIGNVTISSDWLRVKQGGSQAGMLVEASGNTSSIAGLGITNSAINQGDLTGNVIFWAGGNSLNANFKVSDTGDVYAQNIYAAGGKFLGDLEGNSFNGIRLKLGSFPTNDDGDITINIGTYEGRVYNPNTGGITYKASTPAFTQLVGVAISAMGPATITRNMNFPIITGANQFKFNRDNAYDGTEYFSFIAWGI